MNPEFPFASIEEERQKRLASRANGGGNEAELFLNALSACTDEKSVRRIRSAYDYAFTLDYHHPGLSPKAYMAHPVRVAHLALTSVIPIDPEIVATSMIHNVLEVSNVSRQELAARFGENMARTIQNLTVDRSRHDQPAEKQAYYARLRAGGRAGCVVKILDKMDNLFLLGLNPDDQVRADYLAEAEAFLLPLAWENLPRLEVYLKELILNSREAGCFAAQSLKTTKKTSSWN